MLNFIRNKFYRYGIIIAAEGKESDNARTVIEKYDAKMVKKGSIIYKICMFPIPKMYLDLGNIFVYKAKDMEEALDIMRDFNYFSQKETELFSAI